MNANTVRWAGANGQRGRQLVPLQNRRTQAGGRAVENQSARGSEGMGKTRVRRDRGTGYCTECRSGSATTAGQGEARAAGQRQCAPAAAALAATRPTRPHRRTAVGSAATRHPSRAAALALASQRRPAAAAAARRASTLRVLGAGTKKYDLQGWEWECGWRRPASS